MQSTLTLIFELIGTVAFAASGAMVGIKKRMDILGVCVLGLCTAVGGGVIRDVLLGSTPPKTFQSPIYAVFAAAVSVVVFIPRVRGLIHRHPQIYDISMLWMDAIGLGVFTAMGVSCCYAAVPTAGIFLTVFVAVLTGVGGGVLRDMMAGDMPYIFVKHFYASASIIGALLTVLLWKHFSMNTAMILGAACVVALRLCAARYRWSLPKAGEVTDKQ